ncbi:MAG: hypothetical protein AAB432_00275 [Patescibacteria group bacterium]
MEQDNRNIYISLFIFALLVLAGFYLVFDKISSLRSDINNLELSLQISQKENNLAPVALPVNNPPTSGPTSTLELQPVIIPTAIIFSASSSVNLQPQTVLTITVQSVTKDAEGNLAINVKVFNSQSASYSAIQINNLFAIIDLEGDNQLPVNTTGQFDSIPPSNAISGNINFKTDPTGNTIILQIGSGDNLKFYEFNFVKKTYKETIIG